jgi:flagellar M-ring protein FliF
MPAINVDQLRRRASQTLSGFSTGQKVITGLAVAGLIVGALTFSSWAGKPSYAPLFTNLQPSDAAAITQKLTSSKVPFKLADGGASVLVPQSQVYQQRLNLSASGLPTGGSQGYALLDKEGITSSEFRQRVDYQRALEGELAKTVGAIDGVSAATVHLVIPPNDVFAEDSHKPTASVLVQNTPGKNMAPGQVQAVVHLVSSSVEGLSPNDVTVADSKGNVLSAPGEDGMALAQGDARTQQTQAYQDTMSHSLQDMLATVIGPGHAVVKVTADLDYDQRSTTTEQFDNAKPAPALTEQTSTEVFTGAGGPQPGGLLGTAPTTVPGQTGSATAANNYNKNDAARTFAVGKVTSEVKQAPGAVKRLSVAVALDSNAKGADKATVERLITAAAGIDPNRGDSVVVDAMAFDTTAAKEAQKELKQAAQAKSREGMMSTAKTGVVLLMVAFVLFILFRSAKRGPRRIPITVPTDMVELESARTALTTHTIDVDDDDEPMLPVPARVPASVMAGPEGDIAELIERQPDEVAQLLRSWLADRRD